jgi:HlyD family secretion protein
MHSLPYAIPLLGILTLVTAGCVNRGKQELAKETGAIVSDPLISVKTQPVKEMTLEESVSITGSLAVGDTTNVGAKVSGRLVSVSVQEGSKVQSGQILAVQDTSVLQTQLSSAIAQLRVAESQLQTQLRNAKIAPGQADAEVKRAEAAVRQARANLQKGKSGPRPQEIAQAEATVRSTGENLRTQKIEFERISKLVAEGALPQSRADAQRNLVASAQSQSDSATQALALLKEGTRREDIRSLEEAVAQAEAALQQAKVGKELNALLDDQVRTARAQVDVARSSVRQIQQQIEDATIRAPFTGTVTGKPAQPGTVLSPGAVAVAIVGDGEPYFEAQVPEQDVIRMALQTPVKVDVAAVGQTLDGSVSSINPIGSEFGRQFKVKVAIRGDGSKLKPGMFAKGTVVIRTIPNATIVPNTAVVKRDGETFVFTVKDGVAKRMRVNTGLEIKDVIQVTGVSAGAPVIVQGQTAVDDGTKVKEAGQESDKKAESA